MTSFKQKTYLKEYAINQKMYLYKKNNDSTLNNKDINGNFPIDLLNKNNNNKYAKFYNKNKNNINNNMNNNFLNNNKNINTSINNNNNKSIDISKKPFNKSGTNKNNNFIYYNSKNKAKKTAASFANSNANNSVSYNYSNASKINKINKMPQATNPVNTYIINTLNVSEKDFINSGLSNAKPENVYDNSGNDLQNEISKLIKEKEENKNMIKKQKKLIEKFEEDNDNLENRINSIIHENKKIKEKIETYMENQEQLIMLIKIVQKSGVDVEALIDKWNNEVENMEENETSENKESISDEINELNSKIDPSSFIPINIEEPHINKKVFKGIPKLNFSNINNKDIKKAKFKNNSK